MVWYGDASVRASLTWQAKQRARPIAAMSSDWLAVVEWNYLLYDGIQHLHLGKLHEEVIHCLCASDEFPLGS